MEFCFHASSQPLYRYFLSLLQVAAPRLREALCTPRSVVFRHATVCLLTLAHREIRGPELLTGVIGLQGLRVKVPHHKRGSDDQVCCV